jgi:hypothetical protein
MILIIVTACTLPFDTRLIRLFALLIFGGLGTAPGYISPVLGVVGDGPAPEEVAGRVGF